MNEILDQNQDEASECVNYDTITRLTMISMYYNHDFEAHKNLSHKQLWLTVYYFMDYAVFVYEFAT